MALIFFLTFTSQLSIISWANTGVNSAIEGKLHQLREEIVTTEKKVLQHLKTQKGAKERLQEIRRLMGLRTQEQRLGKLRLDQLEKTLQELESKRKHLQGRMKEGRHQIYDSLKSLWFSVERRGHLDGKLSDALEKGRSRVLSRLVERGVQEVETLKIDLSDAEHIETKIQDERDRLAFLFQDLREKESLLEVHKNLQLEVLRKQHTARMEQLEQYQKLKSSEAQLESMLKQFSARYEFQKLDEQEREASRAVHLGAFSDFRGKLNLPVLGKVESGYGRTFDPQTKMYLFKKGIRVASKEGSSVESVFSGRVVFAGDLPSYGRVVILDHGGHYYSLYGNLGKVLRQNGDFVTMREKIGITDEKGSPIYFEIRSKNVPVNPLQWITN